MKELKNWGAALNGELYERWPKDDSGEPVTGSIPVDAKMSIQPS